MSNTKCRILYWTIRVSTCNWESNASAKYQLLLDYYFFSYPDSVIIFFQRRGDHQSVSKCFFSQRCWANASSSHFLVQRTKVCCAHLIKKSSCMWFYWHNEAYKLLTKLLMGWKECERFGLLTDFQEIFVQYIFLLQSSRKTEDLS